MQTTTGKLSIILTEQVLVVITFTNEFLRSFSCQCELGSSEKGNNDMWLW